VGYKIEDRRFFSLGETYQCDKNVTHPERSDGRAASPPHKEKTHPVGGLLVVMPDPDE
jgi:hypothetical protein